MIRLAHGPTLLSIMSSFCVHVLMWFVECVLAVVRILGFKTAFGGVLIRNMILKIQKKLYKLFQIVLTYIYAILYETLEKYETLDIYDIYK